MEVFVTGPTGVLGRPVLRLLAERGHRVRALARGEQRATAIRELGAEPVVAGLFDPDSLRLAVAGAEAVLHLATWIPAFSQAGRPGAWAENDRIRSEGTRRLVDAALGAGVSALVYPSVVFVYPDRGDEWIDAAATSPDPSPTAVVRSTLTAEVEVARFTAAGGRGVVLRMGLFYGPGAGSTEDTLRLARRGLASVIGAGGAYQSSVWVEDAASAVVAAMERAPAGVYDATDDDPLTRRELTSALAAAVGRHRLLRLPGPVARLLGGRPLMRSQRVSNRRLKEATGWSPSVPSAREGYRRLAAG